MKKSRRVLFLIPAGVLLILVVAQIFLYRRRPLDLTFDTAYYMTEKISSYGKWNYQKDYAGHETYLYIPDQYRYDKQREDPKLPLIVVFHGSCERSAGLSRYGRIFISNEFQKRMSPNGACVLVVLSRVEYFTDPASVSLLIQNVVLKNKCIDPTKIVGYGFSQGAKFVVELACYEPRLFKAVISGSGFYQMKVSEMIKLLPVQFYFATSKNDKGIYEQGSPTGKMCARWCKNSRYVEYETRYHFWVELFDKTGRKNKDGTYETALDWIVSALQ